MTAADDQQNALSEETSDPDTFLPKAILKDHSTPLPYYLEHVFPFQFPFYKDEVYGENYGWFQKLFQLCQPLCHATLALSACHCRTAASPDNKHNHPIPTLVEQEWHLRQAIKHLTRLAQNSCPESGLGVVLTVIQLVYYEVRLLQ